MSRAYPHAATVWQREGEDASGRAVWRRRPVPRCRLAAARARSFGAEPTPDDEALLLVPRGSGGCGTTWELRKGDRVAPGRSTSADPGRDALSIESVSVERRGRRVDHYEATAR